MPNKKCQKLTFILAWKTKDCFGVWRVCIYLKDKEYIYYIPSDHAVEEIEKQLYKRHYGKALQILKKFKLEVKPNDT